MYVSACSLYMCLFVHMYKVPKWWRAVGTCKTCTYGISFVCILLKFERCLNYKWRLPTNHTLQQALYPSLPTACMFCNLLTPLLWCFLYTSDLIVWISICIVCSWLTTSYLPSAVQESAKWMVLFYIHTATFKYIMCNIHTKVHVHGFSNTL